MQSTYSTLLLILMIAGLVCSSVKANEPLVKVYVYHLMPPYIVDLEGEAGLYFEFSDYLNQQEGRYRFKTVYLPRKRLERRLKESPLDGVILGVSPLWFKDPEEKKYLWTPYLFKDRDEVISLQQTAFDYRGPKSLLDMRVGGILGFYYYGVDELAAQGKVTRIDTSHEKALISMVLRERVDVGIVSQAALDYLIEKNDWEQRLYVSDIPHDQYERRILVPKSKARLHKFLSSAVKKIRTDPEWQRVLRQYNSIQLSRAYP